jgi:hypothetical protein
VNFRPRRPGETVNYDGNQTRRYLSQYNRWRKGQLLSPDHVTSQGNQTVYRFRSDRATDGFWETVLERQPGEGGSGGSGSASACNFPMVSDRPEVIAACRPATPRLAYIVGTFTQKRLYYLLSDPTQNLNLDQSQTVLFLRPGVPTPSGYPDAAVLNWAVDSPSSNPCGSALSIAPLISTSSTTATACDFSTFPVDATSYYLRIHQSGTTYITGALGFGVILTPPHQVFSPELGGCAHLQFNAYWSYTFHFDDDSTADWDSRCDVPTPLLPFGDNPDQPYQWSCNCPDQVQYQDALPFSPYNSEQRGRSWTGSRSHNAESGPCKHIYAAAFYRNQPFPRPSGAGNWWNYPYRPERIIIRPAATPPRPRSPHDWSMADYRAWRQRAFDQRAEVRRQQREARRREREFFDWVFDLWGVGDRSVPANRWLQARYVRGYRALHNPNIQRTDLQRMLLIDRLNQLGEVAQRWSGRETGVWWHYNDYLDKSYEDYEF